MVCFMLQSSNHKKDYVLGPPRTGAAFPCSPLRLRESAWEGFKEKPPGRLTARNNKTHKDLYGMDMSQPGRERARG